MRERVVRGVAAAVGADLLDVAGGTDKQRMWSLRLEKAKGCPVGVVVVEPPFASVAVVIENLVPSTLLLMSLRVQQEVLLRQEWDSTAGEAVVIAASVASVST